MVTRPFVLTTCTGFVISTLAVELTVDALEVFVVAGFAVLVVLAVREELVVAIAGDPEMLAGGLTTEAAVGDNVRTLANPVGAEMALLVGVIAVPEGAITGPAAFVTFEPLFAVVVLPVTTDEPAMVDADVNPLLATATPFVSRTVVALLPTDSPTPLVTAAVGPE